MNIRKDITIGLLAIIAIALIIDIAWRADYTETMKRLEDRVVTHNEAVLESVSEKDTLVLCEVTFSKCITDKGSLYLKNYTAIKSLDGELVSHYFDNEPHLEGEHVYVPRNIFIANVADTN